MSHHNKTLISVVPSVQIEADKIEYLRKENANLKRQLRILTNHSGEYALLRKLICEIEGNKPIKGVWLP